MALDKKSKVLLIKSKFKMIDTAKTRYYCKKASDVELVIVLREVKKELKLRDLFNIYDEV